MDDHTAFLHAIRADLHDDSPRLVYADWLEERGDQRAEYLRVQISLARTWTYTDQKPRLFARLEELAATIDPGWLAAARRCTTPAPPVDVAKAVPALADHARTAVRLHPRPGESPIDASKLGGLILWPENEPWPDCPEHGIPMAPAVQLRKEDVPEVGFAPGCDLFQLFWCQEQHDSEVALYSPLPRGFWRNRAAIQRPRKTAPQVPEVPGSFRFGNLRPCRLHPERVVEYPDPFEFDLYENEPDLYGSDIEMGPAFLEAVRNLSAMPTPEGLSRISEGSLYQCWLSCADGTKVGGHPDWVQDPWSPVCDCGQPMEHLLSYASREYDALTWGRFVPIEDRSILQRPFMDQLSICEPANCMIGDCGNVYVFVCRHCSGWPVRASMQCS
jgi:uncharacterized protein (TIGR02996 family)